MPGADLLHTGHTSHRHPPVCLIENQNLECRTVTSHHFVLINQAAGCGYNNINPRFQCLRLNREVAPADDRSGGDAGVVPDEIGRASCRESGELSVFAGLGAASNTACSESSS